MTNAKNQDSAKARLFLFLKLFFIGFLMLVLLIPTFMIRQLIREREQRHEDAQREVAQGWGQEQSLIGPILVIPYRETLVKISERGKRTFQEVTHFAYFLPKKLWINGDFESEVLHRGIFAVPVYNSHLKVAGQFENPDFKKWKVPPEKIQWDQAYLTLGLSDLRGIRETVRVDFTGKNLALGPEKMLGIPFNSSIQANLPSLKQSHAEPVLPFQMNLVLGGSRHVNFTPLGAETHVEISSDWPHPSFTGSYLPIRREVNAEGFTADWNIPGTSLPLPSQWRDDEISLNLLRSHSFGTDFIQPVNTYHFTERSVKYAHLFILLTFVAFFLFEIFNNLRIHPIQYLLVGVGLVIFYLLLLSLSEHLVFALAYGIATGATVLLLSFYLTQVLKKKGRALLMAAILTGLYGYLYTLLQAEDFSLLLGSIGLFTILAAIMLMTRKINWYEVGTQKGNNPLPAQT